MQSHFSLRKQGGNTQIHTRIAANQSKGVLAINETFKNHISSIQEWETGKFFAHTTLWLSGTSCLLAKH